MKKLLVFSMVLVSFVSYGQSNKILTDAPKWFKENYVDKTFKDPYSYELLKITIDSMTNLESYTRKSTSDIIELYKKYYDQYTLRADEERNRRRPTYQGALESYEKSRDDYKEKYEKKLTETEFAKNKVLTMSDSEKNKIHHYILRIDCHANNSYGGQVLGRYSFLYDKENGFYSVTDNK